MDPRDRPDQSFGQNMNSSRPAQLRDVRARFAPNPVLPSVPGSTLYTPQQLQNHPQVTQGARQMLEDPRNMHSLASALPTVNGTRAFSFTVAANQPDKLEETRLVLVNGTLAIHKAKMPERHEWTNAAMSIYNKLCLIENGCLNVRNDEMNNYLRVTDSATFHKYIGWINQMTERYTWKVLAKFDHEVRARMTRTGIGSFDPSHLVHEFTTYRLCEGDLMKEKPDFTKRKASENMCGHFNKDGCGFTRCRFKHACSKCGSKKHGASNCSRN
jgi:hypothetical protein